MATFAFDREIEVPGDPATTWATLTDVGARIVIDGSIELTPDEAGTKVRASGSYDVTGQTAMLGASTIRRKGDKVIEQFFGDLPAELAAR